MAPVTLRALTKRYGSVTAVDGIDLAIADREFVVLVGAPQMNLLPGELRIDGGSAALLLADGAVWPLPRVPPGSAAGSRAVTVGLRPEAFGADDGQPGPILEAPVGVVEPLGSDTLVLVNLAGHELIARLAPNLAVAVGKPIRLRPDLARLHLFDRSTGRSLAAG